MGGWEVICPIDITDHWVNWGEFNHLAMRDWRYGIGPFRFDREQYDVEMARVCEDERFSG